MKWKIGNIEIENQIVLAPMAGICNNAFRTIIKEMGAGLIYTEMISAEAIVRGNKKTFDMLKSTAFEQPLAVQIFGDKPETMAKAAKIIVDNLGTHLLAFIDINMGCPVPKIAIKSQSGSALMKHPKKVRDIVSAVVQAIDVPVTVKIRSGWDSKSINAVEIAKIIEEAGASAITVHPRTRAQGYTGVADWNIIKEVKRAVNIPVIGNGDVKTCYDAKRILDETGCDAVMIGRGILGNPWLIKECIEYLEDGTKPNEVTKFEKVNMIKRHIELLKNTKGEKLAVLEMRSHAAWYLKGIPNTSNIKTEICKIETMEEFIKILDEFMEECNGNT